MLFNGTEAYPENELISTLESFGSQFGADVNAYTSYDETVYQLGITDNDDDLVATAVDVLAQWAGHATIDPAQVEAERGVVIEEWRLRDLGLDSRLLQTYEDMLLGASPYGDREPIGVIEQLETMDAERVRRYYERWYRPDLMAVVVVGDVEVDVVEDLIEAAFGGLANPAEPANRPEPRVDPEAVERYVVSTDPEQTDGVAEIMFPGAFPQADTEAGVARTIADGIVLDAMAARLSADATRSVAPYRSTYPSGNAFVRDFDAPSFVVEADTAAIADSVNHVLVEIDRLRQHSLSEQELQRGIDSYTTGYEQAYRERETIQDLDFADRYVAHFLTGAAIPSENDRYNLSTRLLRNLEADDIAASIDRLFGVDPAIVVFGPEADAALLPTADALAALVAASTGVTLEPRPDDAELGELMAAPEPVDVIEERNIVGFTNEPGRALTLANGVQVILYPTNISDDSITLVSSSPGGFSVIPDPWVAEAGLLTDIVFESGVGALDATALEQTLSDRLAYVEPTLTDVNEGFYGSSSTSDLETMLQLVHLYSTAPRIDDRAVETVVDDYRSIYGDLDTDPALAAQFALYSARYGADSRHRQVYIGPTSAELDTVTVEDAQALMADRFGDATGSVFALVGAFDMDEAEDLARRYLGTLPTGREETFADVEAAAPPGVIDETIAAGSDEQGSVLVSLTGAVASSLEVDITNRVLQNILDSRLRDRIREELGATYSPITAIFSYDQPDAATESYIEISGEPERLDEIATEVLAVIADLRTTGPTEEEMDTAHEQLGDELALFGDDELAFMLVAYAQRPELDFGEIYGRDILARNTTAAQIQAHAAAIWPDGQYILIRQVPG